MEPLAGLRAVPTERFALTCHICKKSGDGACIQCTHESGCAAAFHPLCAQLAGLYMRITHPAGSEAAGAGGKQAAAARGAGTQFIAMCRQHTPLAKARNVQVHLVVSLWMGFSRLIWQQFHSIPPRT